MPADAEIDGYVLTRNDNAAANGPLSVTLDGRVREWTLSSDVTLSVIIPTASVARDTVMRFLPPTSGGPWFVSIPVAWLWPDGADIPIAPATGEVVTCVLASISDGRVEIRCQNMSAPP